MPLARKIIGIRILSILVALCSAFLPLELGGGITLESKESWQKGIAPVMVFNAFLLFVISFYIKQKSIWVKWAFTLWLPLNFLSIILISWKIRPTPLVEALVLGLILVMMWCFFSYKIFMDTNETVL